jgi:transcriptional regulator with XRE-family HTH domain
VDTLDLSHPETDIDAPPAATDPMTTDRLRWCLAVIGWSQRECARQLNIEESAVRQMARGHSAIPREMAHWIEQIASFHLSVGMPFGWKASAVQ